MKQPYANYFCQLLYLKLELTEQLCLINIILSGFFQIIKNTISFNALISILENGLKKECEELISTYLKSLKDDFGKNSKLLRILESLINGFDNHKIAFIVDYIEENFMNLVKMRPGFFLIRKLLKTCKDLSTQSRMIKQIDTHIDEFVSSVNGSLLSQCIIRNFCLKECPNKGKSEFCDKLQLNIKKILESLKATKEKGKSLDTSLADNEADCECTEGYINPALSQFYDILLDKVLFSCLNKHSSKILESALRYGGQVFHNKVIEQLSNIDFPLSKNTRLLCLISSERGLKFLKAALEFMKDKDNAVLLSQLHSCIEHLSDKKKKELEDFVGSCNHHFTESNCTIQPTRAHDKEEGAISNLNTDYHVFNTNQSQKTNHAPKQVGYKNQNVLGSHKFASVEVEPNYRINSVQNSTLNQMSSSNYNNEYSSKPGRFAVSRGQFHENKYAYGRFVYGDYSSGMGFPYVAYNYNPNYIKQGYNPYAYEAQQSGENLRKNSNYNENSRFKFAQVDNTNGNNGDHKGHLLKNLK